VHSIPEVLALGWYVGREVGQVGGRDRNRLYKDKIQPCRWRQMTCSLQCNRGQILQDDRHRGPSGGVRFGGKDVHGEEVGAKDVDSNHVTDGKYVRSSITSNIEACSRLHTHQLQPSESRSRSPLRILAQALR